MRNLSSCIRARAAFPVLALALAMGSAPARAEWFSDHQDKMGTRIDVQVWQDDEAAARKLLAMAMAEFDRIEEEMSTYRADSEISRLNATAASHPVQVSDELFGIVARSIEVSRITGGAFDITFDSVGFLYDYRRHVHPSDAEIAKHLGQIDYRHLQLDAAARTIAYSMPGVRINLGGIAKGYSVERVAGLLKAAGVRHGYAMAGGDTRLIGDRHGEPWILGIRDPDKADGVVTRLALEDEAISTSGDYERFFIEGGERYHHILNPRTGKSPKGVRSVSIIGPDATMTDGLSKVFVLGPVQAIRVIESQPGYDTVIVDDHHRVYFSKGLASGARNPGAAR